MIDAEAGAVDACRPGLAGESDGDADRWFIAQCKWRTVEMVHG